MNRLFYCYSIKLKKELNNFGIKYLHSGVHNKTKKTFWVFEGTKELNDYLELRGKTNI